MIIPGFVIGWLTFPGVIVHEFAHKKACQWRGIDVREVSYFSITGGGHVRHERPDSFADTVAISVAPFVFNTLLAVGIYTLVAGLETGAAFAPELALPQEQIQIVTGVVVWLGVSIAWHAIPSIGDAGNILEGVKRSWYRSPTVLLSLPLIFFLLVANALKFLWFDAIYAFGLLWLVFTALGVPF